LHLVIAPIFGLWLALNTGRIKTLKTKFVLLTRHQMLFATVKEIAQPNKQCYLIVIASTFGLLLAFVEGHKKYFFYKNFFV